MAPATRREPEDFSPLFTKISGMITIILSTTTFFMFLGLILSDSMGGLGTRQDVVTSSYFNWHPLLMTATFLLLMTPSVLSFEIFPFPRELNKKLHGTINTFCMICIINGFYIIIDCHLNLSDHGLLNSIHSICGYITFSLFCLTYLGGALLYAVGYGSDQFKSQMKPYHKRFGTYTLFAGFVTILLGLAELTPSDGYKQSLAALVLITMGGVIFTLLRFINKNSERSFYETTEAEDPDLDPDDLTDNQTEDEAIQIT